MGVHYHHQAGNELLLVLSRQFINDLGKVLVSELRDVAAHISSLLLFKPCLLVGREEVLEKLTHQSEASSLVKEIEFLIVFVGFLLLVWNKR